MPTPTRLISNVYGKAVDVPLAKNNIFFAPSECGKSSVSAALAIGTTATADGWWGRRGVTAADRLQDYIGNGRTQMFAEVQFDNGTFVRTTLTRGGKPQREGTALPMLEDSAVVFPLREIAAVLTEYGDDKQRSFFLRAVASDVSAADIRSALPPESLALWERLEKSVRGQGGSVALPIHIFAAVRDKAGDTAKARASEAEAARASLQALEAAAGDHEPTEAEIAEAGETATKLRRQQESWATAREWARLRASVQTAQNNVTAARAALEELRTKGAGLSAQDPSDDTMDAESQKEADKFRAVSLAADLTEIYARYNTAKCGVCTTAPPPVSWAARSRTLVQGREQMASQRQQGAMVSPGAQRAQQIQQAERELARAEGAADSARKLLEERKVEIQAAQAAGRLSKPLPRVDDAPDAYDVAVKELAAAEKREAVLRQRASDWRLIGTRKESLKKVEAEARTSEALHTALTQTISKLLTQASDRFCARVNRYLPEGYGFSVRFVREEPAKKPGRKPKVARPAEPKDICEISLIRPNGEISRNPSGVQLCYLMFGLACAHIETNPVQWALIILPDVSASEDAMARLLSAMSRAPENVTVVWETPILPREVPAGWVVHDLSNLASAPPEVKADAPARRPRKTGNKSMDAAHAAAANLDLQVCDLDTPDGGSFEDPDVDEVDDVDDFAVDEDPVRLDDDFEDIL